jgi:hypothetical protein
MCGPKKYVVSEAFGISPVFKKELGDLYVTNEAIGWTTDEFGFDSKQGQEAFSLPHRIPTGSGAQLTSYTTGTPGSLRGGKTAGVRSLSLTSI